MKVYRNKHRKNLTAVQLYDWMEGYTIKQDNYVIINDVDKRQIEDSLSWVLEEEHEKTYTDNELRDAALQILSKIMFYGDWEPETPNERTLTGIMHQLGYYPWRDETQMIEETDEHELLFNRFKDFDWRSSKSVRTSIITQKELEEKGEIPENFHLSDWQDMKEHELQTKTSWWKRMSKPYDGES